MMHTLSLSLIFIVIVIFHCIWNHFNFCILHAFMLLLFPAVLFMHITLCASFFLTSPLSPVHTTTMYPRFYYPYSLHTPYDMPLQPILEASSQIWNSCLNQLNQFFFNRFPNFIVFRQAHPFYLLLLFIIHLLLLTLSCATGSLC